MVEIGEELKGYVWGSLKGPLRGSLQNAVWSSMVEIFRSFPWRTTRTSLEESLLGFLENSLGDSLRLELLNG